VNDRAAVHEDVTVARILQRGLAPDAVPEVPGLEIAARYSTGGIGEVGGDWYDVLCLPDGGVAVVIGDVAGHGIGAAAAMGQLRHGARAFLLDERSPAAILEKLNRLIRWLLPADLATAAVACVAEDHSVVTVASAGHPPLMWLGSRAGQLLDMPGGPALGLQATASYSDTAFDLTPGEGLLLYTDGLVERRGETIDDGLERLAAEVQRPVDHQTLLDRLIESVPSSAGRDDLAVLAVFRTGV
jgi:serine phosphatase RsbU (regulator of sigma subunit)